MHYFKSMTKADAEGLYNKIIAESRQAKTQQEKNLLGNFANDLKITTNNFNKNYL